MDSSLLASIAKGKALKKTETNDRSQASGTGRVVGDASPPPQRARSETSSGPKAAASPPPAAKAAAAPKMSAPPPPSGGPPPPPPPPAGPPPPPLTGKAAAAPAEKKGGKKKASSSSSSSGSSSSSSAEAPPPYRAPAPEKPGSAPKALGKVRALYDFEGGAEGDLIFTEGAVITVLSPADADGWMQGELAGKRGFFPVHYAEPIAGSASASGASASPAPAASPSGPPAAEIVAIDLTGMFDGDEDFSTPEGAEVVNAASAATVDNAALGGQTDICDVGDLDKNYIGGGHWWTEREPYYRVTVGAPEMKKRTLGKPRAIYPVVTASKGWTVHREDDDFKWLHERLVLKFPSVAVPTFPLKSPSGFFPTDEGEDHRAELERYITMVIRHPLLRSTGAVSHFLSTDKSAKKVWASSRKNVEKDPFVSKAFFRTISCAVTPDANGGQNLLDQYAHHAIQSIEWSTNVEASAIALGEGFDLMAQRLQYFGNVFATYANVTEDATYVAGMNKIGAAARLSSKDYAAHALTQSLLTRRGRLHADHLRTLRRGVVLESKLRRKYVSAAVATQKRGLQATEKQKAEVVHLGSYMRALQSLNLAEKNQAQLSWAVDFKRELREFVRQQIDFHKRQGEHWLGVLDTIEAINVDDRMFA